ncbi:ABC transporter substrate-binding protein [Nonomuraea sp. 10N515B]|uniref:ABC transporter substrate-binding protein n=1 Tax=Nonomuraea sp. 10N515B TaxID=3457422 RepID=UPI003FCC646E
MSQISRRHLLRTAAAAAGGVMLAACTDGRSDKPDATTSPGGGSDKKGDVTEALKRPAKIQESPALKGKGLPPVEQRIPVNPYVIPHRWTGEGKYGGKLKMLAFGSTGAANANSIAEFFYGNSPLRFLNDGLDVGPGLADQWSANDDASEWTVHFREGLKWSDGEPFTVDDILFWWEDLVLPGHNAQTPPPSNISGKGTAVKMTKVDGQTLKFTWDTPQPLFPEQLATYVNGGLGRNGPTWVLPKHYLKQFHPKYDKKVPKDWDTPGGLWEQKADWKRNPDCPTLTGYRCKSFDNNTGIVFERNPYYWVVNTNGDQLPYIDEISFSMQTNAEALKLKIQQGAVDYCQGFFNQVTLADVSTLSRHKDSGHYDILLWNSGDGTGSIFFFNYDYIAKDEKYGKLIRDKRFRQAVSLGWDRKATRKSLYFNQGELTTGTIGPGTAEFHAEPDGPKLYQQWRDSYLGPDPEKAKALLAEIGLKDTDGDGYVEFPDGAPLTIQVPYSADMAKPEADKDEQLVADMKKIGLHMKRVPMSPAAFGEQWTAGQLMSHTNWGNANGTSIMVVPNWLVPVNTQYWAPLEAAWYANSASGKNKEELDLAPLKRHPPRMEPEPGDPVEKLTSLYTQAKTEADPVKRNQLVWQMFKIHIEDGPFFMGSTANFPEVIIKNRDLANVPGPKNLALGGITGPWHIPAPATYDPECWHWTNPEKHS